MSSWLFRPRRAGVISCQYWREPFAAVLVWNWSAWGPTVEPDGFRVYQEWFPSAKEVKTVWGGPKNTVAALPYPSPPWALPPGATLLEKLNWSAQANPCYTVRAILIGKSGAEELSDSSNTLCLKPNGLYVGLQTLTLDPAFLLTRYVYHTADSSATCQHGGADLPSGQIDVGYGYDSGGEYCDYFDVVARGAAWFNLSQLTGPVLSATLKFDRLSTDYMAEPVCEQPLGFPCVAESGPPPGSHSCATNLMLGAEDWMGKDFGGSPHWIEGTSYLGGLPQSLATFDSTIQVDVTQAIKDWLKGLTTNRGFVLKGGDESMPEHGHRACLSTYGNVRLEVTGFFNP